MKFPYSMLLDYVRTELSATEAADLLTMAGFEVEGMEEVEGEPVLDVKVMSNRGDGLSMLGLAREVLAKVVEAQPTELFAAASNRYRKSPVSDIPNPATVRIETQACNRFACRYFDGVSNGESPGWMQKRLRQAGQRPISLLVDLTNYVMLELGQPLHAYDFDKLSGGTIVVREPRHGERLKTLDGREHELKPGQMMICDAERPIGAAGIMGGEETEVSASTTRVLLEAAHFDALSVRRTRKQMGLSTEASYRFERSVDPEGVVAAIDRFSELLGDSGSAIIDLYPGKREREPVLLRIDRSNRLLGMKIKDDEAQRYLQRLGMEVMGHGDPFVVVPPSWRPDTVLEEDLIEELGRVNGYDQIPEALPVGRSTLGGSRGSQQQVDRAREAAIRCGFIQMASHTLRDLHPLDAGTSRISPRNPASPETGYLRNSLWPGLAEAVNRNGGRDLHLFEVGSVFWSAGGNAREEKNLAFLSTGELVPSARKGEVVPKADFFSLKGDLEAVFAQTGLMVCFDVPSQADSRLHPARQAVLHGPDGAVVGVLGQIHPALADRSRLPADTYLAELSLSTLLQEPETTIVLKQIARNPAVRRDIALLIDKGVPYRAIEQAVTEGAGEVLEKQWLFDVFEGQNIPEGKHSLGIALQLRKIGGNFTDEEANLVRERVVSALAELGGTTR